MGAVILAAIENRAWVIAVGTTAPTRVQLDWDRMCRSGDFVGAAIIAAIPRIIAVGTAAPTDLPPPLIREGGGGFSKSPSFGLRYRASSESPGQPFLAARSARCASPPFAKGGKQLRSAGVDFQDLPLPNFAIVLRSNVWERRYSPRLQIGHGASRSGRPLPQTVAPAAGKIFWIGGSGDIHRDQNSGKSIAVGTTAPTLWKNIKR